MSGFELPKDKETRYTAAIAIGALLWLVVCSRAFRDVNAA